ncbi:unnamed protein product, partial [Chrysoparadoxa australica]
METEIEEQQRSLPLDTGPPLPHLPVPTPELEQLRAEGKALPEYVAMVASRGQWSGPNAIVKLSALADLEQTPDGDDFVFDDVVPQVAPVEFMDPEDNEEAGSDAEVVEDTESGERYRVLK